MGTTIIFRRGENDPTSGSGLTLAEPAFNTTLHTFHIGLGHGVTAEWVGAPISGLSADIAAGITYKIPTASAVKNYISGLCFGNTGAATITQYVSSFNGLTGAVGGVCAAQANTFTALQSFASGISASGITVGGSMTVTGNLTVSGGVTFTISENVLIEDNIIILNSNVTGSPSENAGIEIERGTSTNVQLLWNESSDKWTFTNDGSTYYDLPTSVVTSFNGLTGAVTGASLGANTFTGLNSFNAGISSVGGTFSSDIVKFLSGLSASFVRVGSLESNGSNPVTLSDYRLRFTVVGFPSSFYTTLQAEPTTSADRTVTLPDASGTVALTSQLMGAVNGSTAATTAVTSFNGLTGAVQGVSAAVAGTGIAVSGATGAVTITNTGVQSFNGLTGTVTGVTVGGANTFTALNSFNAGISAAGGTFSALTRFTAGISAAGGMTLSGTLNVSSIVSDGDGQVSIEDTSNARVSIGDYGGNNNSTYIYLRDTVSGLEISNPYGIVQIGDPQSVDSGVVVQIDTPNELVDFGTTSVVGISNLTATGLITAGGGFSAAGGTFSALVTFTAGLSAAGGITFSGDIAVNGGDITTTATTATVFNSTATTVSMGGANNSTINIGGGQGVTLNIGTGSLFGETKNINIGTNGTFGNSTIQIGNTIAAVTINSGTAGITIGNATSSTRIPNTLTVGGGVTLGGRVDVGGILDVVGGVTFESTSDHVGVARFASGVTISGTLNGVTATFTGNVTGITFIGGLSGNATGIIINATSSSSELFPVLCTSTTSTVARADTTAPRVSIIPSTGQLTAPIFRVASTASGGAFTEITDAGVITANSDLTLRCDGNILSLGDVDYITNGCKIVIDNSSGLIDVNAVGSPLTLTGSSVSVSGLLNASNGISAAGGTFSALTRFTAGISAAGGMTLAGSLQGSTATFSGLLSASAGISAAGTTAATFGGTVNFNSNTAYKPTLQYYNEPYAVVGITGNGLTLDLSTSQVFGVTLNSPINTLTISNTPSTANRSIGFTLILTADGTPRGITWGNSIKWSGAVAPTLTSTNGKKDVFTFVSINGGSEWLGFIAGQNF